MVQPTTSDAMQTHLVLPLGLHISVSSAELKHPKSLILPSNNKLICCKLCLDKGKEEIPQNNFSW